MYLYLVFLGTPIASFSLADQAMPSNTQVFQNITGDESVGIRGLWDQFFNTNHYVFGKEPAPFLKKNVTKLPVGRALDIAMGEGRNAVFLARKGFLVDGVDISAVALRKARRLARENRVRINTINADLNHYRIRPEFYDVIVNIDYLQRSLVPQMIGGLKKGGVVIFENYTIDQLQNPQGKSIPAEFLLKKGELKKLFKDLKIEFYGETNDGKSAVARLIGRKP